MRTIRPDELEQNPAVFDEIADLLHDDGVLCIPCGSNYRVVAALESKRAVTRLLQSKRRTVKAPSLVFVDGAKMLHRVTASLDPVAERLVAQHWPGPLTILFDPHPDLPSKVVKPLIKANGKLGVRIPESELALRVLRAFGGPLLVSSANPQKKSGASSPAQVRKNFYGRVDLFVDQGDLAQMPHSTVVDIRDGVPVVTRPGAIESHALASGAAG